MRTDLACGMSATTPVRVEAAGLRALARFAAQCGLRLRERVAFARRDTLPRALHSDLRVAHGNSLRVNTRFGFLDADLGRFDLSLCRPQRNLRLLETVARGVRIKTRGDA